VSQKTDNIEMIEKNRDGNETFFGQKSVPDTTIIQQAAKCKQKIPRISRFHHTGRDRIEPNHNILWYIRNTSKTTKK